MFKKILMIVLMTIGMMLGTASQVGASSSDLAYTTWPTATYYGIQTRLFPNGGKYGPDVMDVETFVYGLTTQYTKEDIGGLVVSDGVGNAVCKAGYFFFHFDNQASGKFYCSSHKIGDTIGGITTSWSDTYLISLTNFNSGSGGMNLFIQDQNHPTIYFCDGGTAPTCTSSGATTSMTDLVDYNATTYNGNTQTDYDVGFDAMKYKNSNGTYVNLGQPIVTTGSNLEAFFYTSGSGSGPYNECASSYVTYSC